MKINEVYIEILRKCNLSCSHCYLDEKEKEESIDWIKVIDKLKFFNIKKCVILGGEPIIHKDFWKILSYAISSFKDVTVETNGTLPSFFQNYDCGVAISFESCFKKQNDEIRKFSDSKKSVYNLAVKKMLDGKNYDNKKIIRMTLYNDTDVLASIVFAEKLGANSVFMPLMIQGNAFGLIHRVPSTKKIKESIEICMNANLRMKGYHQVQIPQWYLVNLDLFEKYSSLFKKQGRICSCSIQRLFVNYKGDVFGCPFMERPNFGNIIKDKLFSIEKKIKEFNRKISNIKPQGKCKNCSLFEICGGGCLSKWINNKSKMGDDCPLSIDLNIKKSLKGGI